MSDPALVVVGTTIPAYVMDQEDTWSAWLHNAEAMLEQYPDAQFFAACEVDDRGKRVFDPLFERLREVNGDWWTFSLDDGNDRVTTGNRLRRITTGQNLVVDFALSRKATALLFMAADCAPPADAIPRLLEVNVSLIGGQVDTYCLDGPVAKSYIPRYGNDIREHMPTAAFVLVRTWLFEDGLRWRWSFLHGSDDPCLARDAQYVHGVKPYVHHGLKGRHFPEAIGPIETRGHNMSLRQL